MDLHYLKIFYEVAKEKSFTKAGEKLFINQSAVSIQIKKLEGELKTQLINREAKQIQLTYTGERLFTLAREIFEKVSRAEDEIERVIKNNHAKIIVGATHMVGEPILPKLISEFSRKHQQIEFEIHVLERDIAIKMLLFGEIDILLMGEFTISNPILTVKKIADYPYVLVSKNEIDDLKKLEAFTLIGRDDSILQDKCKSYIEVEHKIHLNKKMVVKGSIETVKNLVNEGLGFAILPFHCVAREIALGELKSLVDLKEYQVGYQVVYCSEKESARELKLFLHFLDKYKVEY